MKNVILRNTTQSVMHDNDVCYTPEYMERISRHHFESHQQRHSERPFPFPSQPLGHRCGHKQTLSIAAKCNYANSNLPCMYSYVAHVLAAIALIAAVAAAESAPSSSGQEQLKFVYENAAPVLALEETIINDTLLYAPAAASTATYGIFNDTWFNASASIAPSSSPAGAASSSSSEYAGAGGLLPPPSSEEEVNVTSAAGDDDWSHFYDLILSWQGICLIAVFCTFIVITIIGNTLVILAVITTRRLKTVTNCFVMSLAVADLLVGIFVMPPAVAVHLIGSWKLGWVLCDIWISLDVLLCTASILSLCAISVDRYLAVTQPLTYSRKRRSKRLALIMILIVWVLALAITCPPILGWYEPGRRDLNECRYNQNEGYVIFSAMGSFFIPMAVMIYVYARISCVVASRHDNMTDISVHNKKFKRYTSADVDNEIDPDLSELDLSSGQKKQQASRTLSNQTLAKELHEIMTSDSEVSNAAQCHSLLALPGKAPLVSPNSNRNGCYELTRPASLRRTPTAASNITIMTSTTGTGTATNTASLSAENPWSFAASAAVAANTPNTPQAYQQHSHPNKHMRTHSVRHQHYLSAPTAMLTVASDPSSAVPATSILRQHSLNPPAAAGQQRVHHHAHHTKSLSNRITSLKKENKTTQTLSIVVGGFIACWLPFFVNYLVTPFLNEEQVSRRLAQGLTWLGWFNSAINPFIYAFYSVDFRAAFWRLTCKRFFSGSSKAQFPANTMSIRR